MYLVGKKKTSVAFASVTAGSGSITVNGTPLANVRPEILRVKVEEPLKAAGEEYFSGMDIQVSVRGGGCVSQIYAIRQAISRALLSFTGAKDVNLRDHLRNKLISYDRALLVADSRRAEAKKFGGRSARTRRQKSYR